MRVIELPIQSYKTILTWIVYLDHGGLDRPIDSIPFCLLGPLDEDTENVLAVLLGVSAKTDIGSGLSAMCSILDLDIVSIIEEENKNIDTSPEIEESSGIEESEEPIMNNEQLEDLLQVSKISLSVLNAWKDGDLECVAPHQTLRQMIIQNRSDWIEKNKGDNSP